MSPGLISIAIGLGLAPGAGARPGPEMMTLEITLRDGWAGGNGIVEPGEEVYLSVFATMDPGPGGAAVWNNYPGSTGAAGTVYAIAGTVFDVLGVRNSGSGSLTFGGPSWILHGGGTLVPATQSVLDFNAAQLAFLPLLPGNTSNPIEVFRGTWVPHDFTPRVLEYEVRVDTGAIYMLVQGYPQPVGENTVNNGSSAAIQIVPEPGAVVVPGVGIGIAGMRRRRR